jgi:ribosome biogenesis protein MAK21
MGRRSQKNGSRSLPSASKPENIPFDGKQPQTLDTQAFSDLSQKIQARFNKLRQDGPEQNRKQQKRPATMTGDYVAPRPKMRSVTKEAQGRGQKRDSEGAAKKQGRDDVSNESAETLARTKSVLEKEVYALGGTAEDLALVANLESDSELDDASERNKAFRKTKLEKGLWKGIADILKQVDERGESIPLVSDAEGADDTEENDEEEQNGKEYPSLSPSAGDEIASQSLLGKSVLLVAPRPDWFNIQLPATKIACTSNPKFSPDSVQQLHEHAKSLLHEENEAFKATQRTSSSQKFYSTVIASGTVSDKISALTLAVQESPLHNVKALETLVNLGKKRSRAQALDVLRALKDLFGQGSLLPSDRKLNAFSTHPSLLGTLANINSWKRDAPLPGSLQPQHLIVWAYESWLKEEYFEVLKILETWCNDEIEFSKSKAVHSVYELLKEKPEQESNLLRLLTNKLGDPCRKIASQTSYLLMQLMTAHPLMKMTVISSIELDLLFRPGQSLHAKYYAVITLNQTALSGREEDVASKLLYIYFSLFVGLLKPADSRKRTSEYSGVRPSRTGQGKSLGKGPNDAENAQAEDLREKLTSAILTGINRAYPYTEPNGHK